MYDISYSFIFLGSSNAGKTKIIHNITKNQNNYTRCPTIGIDYFSTMINYNNNNIRIRIYDSGGLDRFYNLTKQYIKNISGVIICADVSNINTSDIIIKWIDTIRKESTSTIPISIIITKMEEKIDNVYNEIKFISKQYGLTNYEYSNNDKNTYIKPLTDIIDTYNDLIEKHDKLEDKDKEVFKEILHKKGIFINNYNNSSKKMIENILSYFYY
jgi:small GTP-binding protein